MDPVRKLILEKAQERDINLAELSRLLNKNHAYMQQFIRRGVPLKLDEDDRRLLAHHLGIEERLLMTKEVPGSGNGTVTDSSSTNYSPPKRIVASDKRNLNMSDSRHFDPSIITEVSRLLGERDLPIYGTAQGGKGAVVLTNEPVDWEYRPASLLKVKSGYGVIVSGDSMSPEHKAGSIALVNPTLHPQAGDTCVFRATAEDGTMTVCIKILERQTADLYYVRQREPKKSFTLKKSEWQECHVTVANHFTRR